MKYGPPSPREFGRVHLKLNQAQPEFTRRGGWGVRSNSLFMGRLFSTKRIIKRVFFAGGYPLTPNPSPQKFGESLISLGSITVRIYGERGARVEQRNSEVSAIDF